VPLGWGNFWVPGVRNNVRPVSDTTSVHMVEPWWMVTSVIVQPQKWIMDECILIESNLYSIKYVLHHRLTCLKRRPGFAMQPFVSNHSAIRITTLAIGGYWKQLQRLSILGWLPSLRSSGFPEGSFNHYCYIFLKWLSGTAFRIFLLETLGRTHCTKHIGLWVKM
jgi:hypothetical protein